MEIVGWIATGVVAVVVLGGVVAGLFSVPDMKRYLKIRGM